ncbi:X-Pro dipeptidyl-peptidase-domain-containing protein [Fusarium solani]|uniref:X-Pro dipeptidyl-peptidase-domain-containing protein n=1 Tax=Fusarium solani TaxID=169388 RepID=A0A9P9G669_FUSSL|nr:X-Pro dipeptidyl-peptidase-domain-containing protein [Fusarium solani]KAH7231967.1 X-Pro dipeptidyl-peptidase-domain-containing protein [Fusarium solani]
MAQSRGIINTVLDSSIGWLLGLPSERCGYTTETASIPMKDGAILAADLYKPAGMEPLGTILAQCSYGRGIFMAAGNARIFAPRGYQILLVSCRGTFGSTGDFNGGFSQLEDGQEIVSWMREQPWYTGTFATLGASFMGYAQWALLRDPPKDMVAAIITIGPHDFAESNWGTGALRLQQRLSWADLIVHQETATMSDRLKMMGNTRIAPMMNATPLQEHVDAYFGDKAPWLTHSLTHPDITDPSWEPQRHAEALEKADIPILLISGWHDVFLDQTMYQYQRLHERGCNVALSIGPGAHMDVQNGDSNRDTLVWLEKYLAGKEGVERKSPVRVCVGSPGQEWLELPSWPPHTTPSEFYLRPDGALEKSAPSEDASSSFTFNPEDHTPTVGGPLLTGGGSTDDTALAARDDTLVFTTEALKGGVLILGQPVVKLEHSTDRPYADLFVRLSEVNAKGKSHNVTEAFTRLPVERDSRSVTIPMRHIAHNFPVGSRIRLLIAGGSHPQFARNYGSGEPLATGTTLITVKHTVYHGTQGISSIVLPVG